MAGTPYDCPFKVTMDRNFCSIGESLYLLIDLDNSFVPDSKVTLEVSHKTIYFADMRKWRRMYPMTQYGQKYEIAANGEKVTKMLEFKVTGQKRKTKWSMTVNNYDEVKDLEETAAPSINA